MNDEKKPEPKKNFSNSLVLIVMGVILSLIVIQNFIETKVARVSFSYQLEPLVNLDLIQPEDSRKTAAASNLVTFAGRFRDRLTDEGKNRYKYLELLDNSHELAQEKDRLQTQLGITKKRVDDAAQLYLRIAGQAIPAGGYNVFDELYDSSERRDHIVIKNMPEKTFASLAEIQSKMASQSKDTTINDLQVLVRNLRSPLLGIGNEQIKQALRTIDSNLSNRNVDVDATVAQLSDICKQLNQQQDHIRLTQLRSVRAYKDTLDQITATNQKIEDNKSKLEKASQAVSETIWFFNNQELSTRALEKQDPELFHQWFVNEKDEWMSFDANKGAFFKAPDQPLNKVLEKTFKSEELAPNYISYLLSFAPVFLILFLLYLAFSRQMKGMGTGALDFNKSPARLYPKGANKVTFKDVAGIDECLEELQEIVEFLKNPQKFTALGGRIPKGVLCIGSPGTGKTLVAKAVAGEADCPFFSISGSDFVEMFVGVGASRIRKMFEEAKKNAPCIIFMDEIDAVGRHRGAGVGGGHDEREQTLNQLLVEMDGFDTTEGIIIIAATNRPDVLDKALLRPGRFDRQVYIPLPDIKGRFEILKVHARKIKMDATVDLMALARSTPGCSGADLANLLNEAALLAARNNRTAVTAKEVFEARDKVLYGKERRNLEIDEQEKKTTAFHESGHAVVGCLVKTGDPVDKVTIIPRGYSLGATQFLPKKNRLSYWKTELLDQLAVLMGGRAAEEIFVHDVSSGAKQDIERATSLARSMVCEWGMSDKLGTVTYDERSEGGQYLGMSQFREKLYSEATAQEIDAEVKEMLQAAYQRSKDIIQENQDIVVLMTDMLMEFETIDAEDVEKMIKREWNIDEKRSKLKLIEEQHKKTDQQDATTPPPAPPVEKQPEENFQLQAQ
ncbi:MAG: ATP-dependent zinc metalloprotease FtsH [Verrucomicrobia bacterium]|nr:ATP-dependent zinc metalloprotease FtsH [Verrucomicrobiota bacterium]